MAKQSREASRRVYSTDKGRLCPECNNVKVDCRCRLLKTTVAAGDGIVRLRRETKGRGGKAVTIVTGLAETGDALAARAKVLKRRCGVGGAVKDGNIEIQGDQRALIKTLLEGEGLTVKIAGG
ncbi:MAG: stress response translation initiation inhibitor YciH [Congregibacter sp.]